MLLVYSVLTFIIGDENANRTVHFHKKKYVWCRSVRNLEKKFQTKTCSTRMNALQEVTTRTWRATALIRQLRDTTWQRTNGSRYNSSKIGDWNPELTFLMEKSTFLEGLCVCRYFCFRKLIICHQPTTAG